MTDIVTITPSPAIDLSTAVDRIMPVAKLRGRSQRRDPGGGGIHVARVIRRLGGDARAIYPVGGAIGKLLRQLLDQEGVASHTWTIAGETRENFFVDEISAGQQYRFILPGPRLHEAEWKECLKLVSALEPFPRYLVATAACPMAFLTTSMRRWRELQNSAAPGSCWIRRDRRSPRQRPKASISSSQTYGKCVS